MKRFILIIAFLLIGVMSVNADQLTLVTPETEVAPEVFVIDWRMITLDIGNRDNIMSVDYYKLNDEGRRIPDENGKIRRTWRCYNIPDNPDTPGTDESDPCWDDVFMFTMRTQDVGTSIGRGFRQLIYNKMKNDPAVMGVGNDGTFDD